MSDIKKTSDKDLAQTLKEKQAKLKDFRFGVAGSKVRNVREGRALRRDIARILTESNSRKQ